MRMMLEDTQKMKKKKVKNYRLRSTRITYLQMLSATENHITTEMSDTIPVFHINFKKSALE